MHWLEKWLLPPKCVISGQESAERDIAEQLVEQWAVPKAVCPQCCEPSFAGEVCGRCLTQPPAFDQTQVGFYFDAELTDLIHGLKYQGKPAYARVLGELLAEKIQPQGVEALLAVPLYSARYRQRGFNQAELIAETLADKLAIPLIKQAVFRVKDTPSQTHLNAKQRGHNLKNAFDVDSARLQGIEKIALLDDVITTGATMQSLAQKIKQHTSIEQIQAWAVAKTK
ncbi:phosphoribosyltransferase [Thiomicrorhabdus immobilis]|uniref:Phosphoribosyltransferase n=1 Tax=Thiomicrorhabdus immobilis TaxID=2791037 RepID=A0ABM7MAQ0_9GAMM|nr:ComF family protein [Thiomicrorhabdus immobilis]BCN92397.1 phosphoribosyltransferase [Thiomicrorhabdus immobilis]